MIITKYTFNHFTDFVRWFDKSSLKADIEFIRPPPALVDDRLDPTVLVLAFHHQGITIYVEIKEEERKEVEDGLSKLGFVVAEGYAEMLDTAEY